MHLLQLHWLTAAGVKHASRLFPGKTGAEKGGPGEKSRGTRGVDFGAPISSSVLSRVVPGADRARALGNKYKNHPINPMKVRRHPNRKREMQVREAKKAAEAVAASLTIREEFTVVSSSRALTRFFHYRVGKGVTFSRA